MMRRLVGNVQYSTRPLEILSDALKPVEIYKRHEHLGNFFPLLSSLFLSFYLFFMHLIFSRTVLFGLFL